MGRINHLQGSRSASLRGAVAFSFLCTIPLLYSVLLIPAAGTYAFNRVVYQNFHEVIPGKLFRAGEMSPERLKEVIDEHGIKTVVDLRLGGPGDMEYGVSERRVVEESGATYVHAKLRSSALPTQQRMDRIFEALDSAQTPVLFHCTDGVHRTGFATVLWLTEHEGVSFDAAMKQISLWYGYFEPEQRLKSAVNGEPTLISLLFDFEQSPSKQKKSLRAWLEQDIYPTLAFDPSS